jgi:hypothetical protein
MHLSDYDLIGRSFDEALDLIQALPSPEEKAQALIRHGELLTTARGTALMKKIAAPTTPGCQRLGEILEAREAERARKKAERARKKAFVKPERYVMGNLLDLFAEASPPEDINESHDQK